MHVVLTIAFKDLLLRFRDRVGFCWWMVGFPLLIAILIGTIFSGVLGGPARPMQVALVDEDGSPAAREFAAILLDSPGLRVEPTGRSEAQDSVRRGGVAAFVVLRQGFRLSPAVFWDRPLPVAIGADPSRPGELAFLQATLNAAAIRFLRERWLDPARRTALIDAWLADLGQQQSVTPLARAAVEAALTTADSYLRPAATAPASRPVLHNIELLPVDAERIAPGSSFEVCFPLGIIWGLLGLAAEFAMAMAQERERGTLVRLRVAPITRIHILCGSGLACFLSSLGVMLYLLAVGHLVFGVRLANLPALAMALPCIGWSFVGLTLLLSVLGRTESAVSGAAWACLLLLAMLGGGIVPQIFLPSWMEAASFFSPVRWAILGLEGGIWRGFSSPEMLRPCLMLLAQGAVCALAGLVVLSRSDR